MGNASHSMPVLTGRGISATEVTYNLMLYIGLVVAKVPSQWY